MKPADQYGSVQGKYGELHDWYLIVLALFLLWAVMKTFPRFGIIFGWIVLLGAVLYAGSSQGGFQNFIRLIQTGTFTGETTKP